ncbi:MAG: hypothetical protein H0V44_03135 [Planctomycetes bacterium]|nr:hypothetical protein [Planctomycetota bacterium]
MYFYRLSITILCFDSFAGQIGGIGNALTFCEERAPAIRVTARVEPHEVVFAISDNGIGISQDEQARIFQIFQRIHGQDRYPGSGIGLATCQKIVERHGGRIWVESTPGVGSMFFFSLPL